MNFNDDMSRTSEIMLESVRERDIDLLLMHELYDHTTVGESLLRDLFGEDYILELVQHSRYDETGESDIMLIAKTAKRGRVAVLIEDKVDAPAQPDQYNRYKIRGDRMLTDGAYDDFEIVLIAPEKYIASSQAVGYEKSISYEYLRDFYEPATFGYFLLSAAIDKQQKGYTPLKDDKVTSFWQQLYAYIEDNYQNLTPYVTKGDRGVLATWIPFRLGIPDARIQVKADRGHTDLEIGHQAERIRAFSEENKTVLQGLKVYTAGKSVAVRIETPELDFHKPFDSQISLVEECLKACEKLQDLSGLLKISK